jgi:hypothetical protein
VSIADTIRSLKNADLTVRRRTSGGFSAETGLWEPGPVTTFVIEASVQPATGMQRVVGGRDMRSDEEGQHVSDVRVIYTPTQLMTRSAEFEPDEIDYDGGTWTVVRVEAWNGPDGPTDTYYKAMITRETRGAA